MAAAAGGDSPRKKLLLTIRRQYTSLSTTNQKQASEAFEKTFLKLWGERSRDASFDGLLFKVCKWLSLEKPKLSKPQERDRAVRCLEDYAKSLIDSMKVEENVSQTSHKFSDRPAFSKTESTFSRNECLDAAKESAVNSDTKFNDQSVGAVKACGSLKVFAVRVEGTIVRFKGKDIQVGITDEIKTDDKRMEVSIPRNALFSSGVRLNPGDVVTFKQSEKDPCIGYAPEVVRIVKMEQDEMERYIKRVREKAEQNPHDAIAFITRCMPPWTYVCSQSQLSSWMTSDILDLVSLFVSFGNCLRSDARLGRILKSLANSRFTATILQKYVKSNIHSYFSPEADIIQRVVEALIQSVPERCTRLLPIIEYLAQMAHHETNQGQVSCIASSQDEGLNQDVVNRACDSWKSVEFILRTTRTLAVSVFGASEDVASLNWHELPIVPSVTELLGRNQVEDVYIPTVLTDRPYESEDAYLDTYFRLLREDCFHELKVGIQRYLKSELDERDMALYRIHLDGLRIDNTGLALSVRFKFLGKRVIDWNYSRLLMFGNLVCISTNAVFDEPIWAMIAHRTPELLQQGIVFLTLSSEHNRLSDAEVVLLLQSCANISANPHKAMRVGIMAESPSYYRAYGPVLRSLKDKSSGLPFKEELVDIVSSQKSPEYLQKGHIDWSCIFDKNTSSTSHESSIGLSGEDSSPIDEFENLVHQGVPTTFDETQLSAIKTCLKNRVSLIQGPPGTGKSFIGVKLVQLILSMDEEKPEGPILVLTYKNHALDQFLEDCLQFCKDLVRVGGRSQSEKLKQYNLNELKRDAFVDRDIKGTKRQLTDLKEQLPLALHQMKNAPVFSVNRFIEVATLEQIQSLCQGCPVGLVDSSLMSSISEIVKLIKQVSISEYSAEIKDVKSRLLQSPKMQATLSCLLVEWTPASTVFLSVCQPEKVPRYLLSEQVTSTQSKPSETLDEYVDDEDEIEDIFDKRCLTQDIEVNAKLADRWRDPKEGFLQIDDVRSSKMPFACVLPHVVGNVDGNDVIGVDNLWHLPVEERARLILYWMSRFKEEAQQEVVKILNSISELSKQLEEQKAEDYAKLISKASIVGMTTTGAAINSTLINVIAPKIILVEEAAEILEAQLIAVLPSSAQHLIMIGDHQQLRPQVQSYTLKRDHGMDVSMFERLIKHLPLSQLGYQCRMREEFVALIQPIYPDLKTHKELVKRNWACKCVRRSMFFWTHSFKEELSQYSRSWCNKQELEQLLLVLNWLILNGHQPEKITILSAYRGQLLEIRAQLQHMKATDVVTSTIDRYQGDENDFVLVSLVRSRRLGFLAASNRMCVAASRARCGVYFFGNDQLLRKGCWKQLIEHMESVDCFGVVFPLVCPIHLVCPVITSNGAKCVTKCATLLSCGHHCSDLCHLSKPHPKCKVNVEFKFPKCGHPLQRVCHVPEKDLYCKEMVQHEHPQCKHTIHHPCWQDIQSIKCQLKCERCRPQCGHACELLCHQNCVSAEKCSSCDAIKEETSKKQARASAKNAELQRVALEKELQKLRNKPPEATCLVDVSQTAENDLFRDIQERVSWFLPATDGMEITITSLKRIMNYRLHKQWLSARLRLQEVTDFVYRFLVVSQAELEDVIEKGIAARKNASFNEVYSKPLSEFSDCEESYCLVRFKVLKGKCKEYDCVERAVIKKEGFDSGVVQDKVNGLKRLILLSSSQAMPDYVASFAVTPMKTTTCTSNEPGMTFKPGHFEVRSLLPSRNLKDRLDELFFREAESQFYRMFRIQEHDRKSVRVVQVDVVDNGDLNIRYRKKKQQFEAEKKPVDELFVFHGTSDTSIDAIIREGFKIGGKDIKKSHGSAYGIGVYTAEDPLVAMGYGKRGESQKLLLSRILPGREGEDYKHGRSEHVFVLETSEQLLPQFVVHIASKLNSAIV